MYKNTVYNIDNYVWGIWNEKKNKCGEQITV